jgi:hypothetical protein
MYSASRPLHRPDDLPYWLALNGVKGFGPARFQLLFDAFGSAAEAWSAEAGWFLALIPRRRRSTLAGARSPSLAAVRILSTRRRT